MRDLTRFRERVTVCRKQVGCTEEELARELFISKGELNKRLHEYKHPRSGRIWRLSDAEVFRIVEVLAQWEAITTQQHAIDLLDMMAYPHLDSIDWAAGSFRKLHATPLPGEDKPNRGQANERLNRLRAILIDHSGFLGSRLESFVGRQTELAKIHHRISTMLTTGGYITITGRAGQGKSSIIANLVYEYGLQQTAHHFIPFNPGPDYQVNLLRDLMARLILKHDLPDLYVVSESRPALRDFFPKVLTEIAAKGAQEVIFIDGLDQLQEDAVGERDLSFLPNNPPSGIVFILGTRPDDTLQPLELRKPHWKYNLPDMSRHDFDLILEHRGAKLEAPLADRFYQSMQKNALYLDLLAKELVHKEGILPEELIEQIADDPDKIFSLSIARLKRDRIEWREVLKPILGVLLATREPLLARHIRHILHIEEDRLRDGLVRLGGLIADDGKGRYSLFHLKLYDYLRQDESDLDKEYIFASDEEEECHKRLARWCETGEPSVIWQDTRIDVVEQGRREYARKHYITHLYSAKERQRLFDVLDEGAYGRGKVSYDPSTRLYAQDLDLGRQAAARSEWTMEEGLSHLSHLWRYTLLRCSLTTQADRYPPAAIQFLLLLKQESKAIGLTELMTQPERKAVALLHIAKHLVIQPGREAEGNQMLMRVCESVHKNEMDYQIVAVLRELTKSLVEMEQWRQVDTLWAEVEMIVRGVGDDRLKEVASHELVTALIQAEQWDRADVVISLIPEGIDRTLLQREILEALIKAEQWERAEAIVCKLDDLFWRKESLDELLAALAKAGKLEHVDAIISTIERDDEKARMLIELGKVLGQIGQLESAVLRWAESKVIARSIDNTNERTGVLIALGGAFIEVGQLERAKEVWAEAEAIVNTIEGGNEKARSLCMLAQELAQAEQWEYAEVVCMRAEAAVRKIVDGSERVLDLSILGRIFVELGQQERAKEVWAQAEVAAHTIQDSKERAWALDGLLRILVQSKQWEQAEAVARSIDDRMRQAFALQGLVEDLTQAEQWEWAETLARSIEEKYLREWTFQKLEAVLIKTEQWERAEAVAHLIEGSHDHMQTLRELAAALTTALQWERAATLVHLIQDGGQRVEALSELGAALARAEQWEGSDAVWAEVEAMARTIEDRHQRTKVLDEMETVFIKTQQWQYAEAVISMQQSKGLIPLMRALIEGKQWEYIESRISIIDTEEEDYRRANVANQIVHMLVQAKQLMLAERVIKKIEIGFIRAEAMNELVKALANDGQWERAETLVRTVENGSQKAEILGRLMAILTQAGQSKRVGKLIKTAGDDFDQAKAMSEMAEVLARDGQWEQAEQIASKIGIIYRSLKDEALSELAKALAKDGQWERAEAMARSIENSNQKAEALNEVILALILAGRREHAEAVGTQVQTIINTMKDSYDRTHVTSHLAAALAKNGQWEWAESLARSIENKDEQVKALLDLGAALAEGRQWERAEALAYTLENRDKRIKALRDIVVALAREEQYERAETLARTIEGYQQERVLGTLALTLIEVGQWERAEAMADAIEDSSERTWVLQGLLKAFINAKQWERAEELIHKKQGISLSPLVIALSEDGRWEQAEAVITTIQDIHQRTAVLYELMVVLTKIGQREQAEAIWAEVEEANLPTEKDTLNIEKIVEFLSLTGRYEQLLHLVQRLWLQAKSREESINRLASAHGLIPLNPRIGVAFCEAFTWVDSFLEG